MSSASFPDRSVSSYQDQSAFAKDDCSLLNSKVVVAVVVVIVVVTAVIGLLSVFKAYGSKKLKRSLAKFISNEELDELKEDDQENEDAPPPPSGGARAQIDSSSSVSNPFSQSYPQHAARAPMRGSIMDQRAGLMREEAENEVLTKDGAEPSGGARALPSSIELAEQSMAQYEQLAASRKPGERVQQEGENPMFHSQFYYEEGAEQNAEAGSGDADKEVMSNLVSATGGLLTQAEDLFAAGNDAYERDAWGMYKPSLATLQKARDLGSRVSGGVLAQATDSWGGRSVGGNGVTPDPSRSLYGIQDMMADTTKVPVETFVQDVLAGKISAKGSLPFANLPSYISG